MKLRISRTIVASVTILMLASDLSLAQDAGGTAPPESKPDGAQQTPLPPLEVTTSSSKKAKPKATAKASAAKAAQVQAEAIQPAPPPTTSDGGSTAPGAVNGYVVKEGTVGTKTNTPLQEVPQSISTVTRQQLEDRKPQSLGESLAYVPGVRLNQSGFDPRFDAFFIRGFDATYTGLYRDGLRQQSSGFGQFRTEPYGLDSITVLRGPSAALYGASNAGGIVDMYTKRPTEIPFNEVEYLMGNYDRFQGNFDFSGPAGSNKNVLYRMTGVVHDSDTQFLGLPDDRLYLAPAFTFKIDPDTKLTVFGEYMDAKTGANTAWLNDFSDPNHTRLTNIWSGDPAFNAFDQTQERVGYEFEHRLNDAITVRQKARYTHLDENAEYIDIVEETSPNVFSRAAGIVESNVHTGNMDNQVEARFGTGAVRHTVLAGIDATYITYKEGTGFGYDVPPLVDFNYGQQHIPAPPIDSIEKQDQFAIGAYLQDQLKLDRWVVTLSGRHDWVHTEFETTDLSGPEPVTDSTTGNDQAWSGRAGLTYLFDSGFAPYIAYGTSFVPNAGGANGTPFNPTTAESKEIGFKYLVPGYNASLNGALFDIEQKNGVFYDPAEDRSVQRGTLRSRGFEIEGVTSLNNGLSLQASYTYVDMKILDGVNTLDEPTIGKTLSSTPKHTASIWADYTIHEGALHGLGFGSGVRYIGTSYGNDINTFQNDAHALVDVAAHYDLAGLAAQFAGARLQLNVSNIADKRDTVCSDNYCYEDQGRTVLGSLRYRW
jgi:iron complex outermembrane receptor protein